MHSPWKLWKIVVCSSKTRFIRVASELLEEIKIDGLSQAKHVEGSIEKSAALEVSLSTNKLILQFIPWCKKH